MAHGLAPVAVGFGGDPADAVDRERSRRRCSVPGGSPLHRASPTMISELRELETLGKGALGYLRAGAVDVAGG